MLNLAMVNGIIFWEGSMDLGTVYTIGIPTAFIMALIWSVLDKQKPPTKKEFVAKLVARALLFIVFLAVSVGFLSIAFV